MNDRPPSTTEPSAPRRVEARTTKDYSVRMFIFAVMLLAIGIYTFYDGYLAKEYPFPDVPFELKTINQYFGWATNCVGPFVFLPLGLLVLVRAVQILRRVLVADDEGIGYAGKRKVAWADIEEVDASRLKAKQILELYDSGGRRLTLDSWKHMNFRDLVAMVEKHVPAEKISQ